ncbi:DUF4230 domain-containing protein [Anaerococcus hydrogenalis]|uniref:Conserved domain protein n=1 Tax=Anaerococcus hydrogenalis ACS-025-V-Sch4 TaxID=879306 RepID=F0H0A6_9FIRM|nr:DUF4230 domain-containing protein [Anaerococcus hydrogenalis]EGC84114.1 conserved domain protein [Anaerococcus hydrogenalis ACS-025-V-Sch4]
MIKKKSFIKSILIGILLITTILFGAKYFSAKNENKIDNKLIQNRIESAKELTTLKYSYTNMGQFENSSKIYGYDLPFTQKKFIVSYDGMISYGVDLEKMDVKVSGKNINIKLPKSKVLSHEIYEDSLKIFDQKTSIFNPIKLEDYNDFSKKQKKSIEKSAEEKGILKEADKKCEKAIKDIINIDKSLDDYTINIQFK